MCNAHGAVPRRAYIPLHVGVPGVQLATSVESEVIRVAIAHGDQLEALAELVRFDNPTARRANAIRMSARIFDDGCQIVFTPQQRYAALRTFRQGGVVATDNPQLVVWADHQSMGTMLATALERTQEPRRIRDAVAVRVVHTPQACARRTALGYHAVQGTVMPNEAMCATDAGRDACKLHGARAH